jgi:iron transport multicopper oxidase
MALSLANVLYICSGFFLLCIKAELRTYDFNVSWVARNPDGLRDRPVIGINGEWPIPHIEATVGDRIIVNVHNQLGNESTSLHFHGLFMNGTNEMDGVVGVTQCGIPPHSSFTYNFTVHQMPCFQRALLTVC